MINFTLSLTMVSDAEVLELDRIEFDNAAFVRLAFYGLPGEALAAIDEAVLVFPELVRSLSGDGRYLIFTSACGVADDGGWEGVVVRYHDGHVSWTLPFNDEEICVTCEEAQYRREIARMQEKVARLPDGIVLEPKTLIFPESWKRWPGELKGTFRG